MVLPEVSALLSNENFWLSFYSNFVFWVFDVIIIVMLFPLMFSFWEKRKWKPMRTQLQTAMVAYLEDSVEVTQMTLARSYMGTTHLRDISAWGLEPWGFEALDNNSKKMGSRLDELTNRFENALTRYTAAISPELSKAISELIAYVDHFHDMSLALVRYHLFAEQHFARHIAQPDMMLENLQAGRVSCERWLAAELKSPNDICKKLNVLPYGKAPKDLDRQIEDIRDSIERIEPRMNSLLKFLSLPNTYRELAEQLINEAKEENRQIGLQAILEDVVTKPS